MNKTTLYLISKLYHCLVLVRWFLYKSKLLTARRFKTPIISVGNISIGGSGKTPMVVYLSSILTKTNIKHVIVSRGYKKKLRGTVVVQNYNTKLINDPCLAGDEPVLMSNKLDSIPIVADNNKTRAIDFVIKRFKPEVILLDDGFQSLYIKKNTDLVLIDSSVELKKYKLLPLGFLREKLQSLKRADLVVFINKGLVNSMSKGAIIQILKKLNVQYLDVKFMPALYLYNYKNSKLEKHTKKIVGRSIAICGIGNPETFLSLVQKYIPNDFDRLILRDHFNYFKNQKDIYNIIKSKKTINIITTYKDYVKLIQLPWIKSEKYNFYIIDISPQTNQEKKLLEIILRKG
tara:strand:- start:4104 stop:5141 length:1038 start_codon:yes stop_codon:yes gene_type:complete